jgi:hypothetical protein
MKKTFFFVLITCQLFAFIGCKKDSSTNNRTSSSTYSWSCKIDGKSYSWSGILPYSTPNSTGNSSFIGDANISSIVLGSSFTSTFSFSPCDITFALPPLNTTGSYSISSTDLTKAATIILQNSISDMGTYTSSFGGTTMNVTISSITSGTFPTAPGRVIGTFQGQLKGTANTGSSTLKTINVTEGKFEAIRIQ